MTDSHLSFPAKVSTEDEPVAPSAEVTAAPIFLAGRDEASPPQPQTKAWFGIDYWRTLGPKVNPPVLLVGAAALVVLYFLLKLR
jgi:hypothetical protein